MNGRGIRIVLTGLLAVFAASYCIYTVVRFFHAPYETETAFEYVVADSCRTQAVAVREESVIDGTPAGVLNYVCEDSQVVKPGTVVAEVYSSQNDLRWQKQIEQCEREVELLQTAQGSSVQFWGSEVIGAQIDDTVGSSVSGVLQRDLSGLIQQRERLQLLLGRRQVTTGRQTEFSDRIAQLNAQKEYAASQISQSHSVVAAPVGGYFCSAVDGYESLLSAKDIDMLSVADCRYALSDSMQPETAGGVGKVQIGHNWYLLLLVSREDAQRFSEGAQLTLDFEAADCHDIPASVYRVIDDGEEECAVVLQCGRINEKLIQIRHATVEVRFKSYSGLRVSAQALRYDGETEGVYVIQGGRIVFKPVTRLYSEETFVICEYNELDGSNALQLFDEVIVEGVDLYDGKVA